MVQPFDCWGDCYDQKRKAYKADRRHQRACSRQDLPPLKGNGKVHLRLFRVYLGRPADPELDPGQWGVPAWPPNDFHEAGWRTPFEDVNDGCPAGWMRSPFALSLEPYLRTRTESGDRASNLTLDQCDDRLIRKAVMFFERAEERLVAHRARLDAEKRRATQARR